MKRPAQVAAKLPTEAPELGELGTRRHDGDPAGGAIVIVGDDVLDVAGVAALLRVGRNHVYTLVGRNAIPHRRVGKHLRFNRGAIMRWLEGWSTQVAQERQKLCP